MRYRRERIEAQVRQPRRIVNGEQQFVASSYRLEMGGAVRFNEFRQAVGPIPPRTLVAIGYGDHADPGGLEGRRAEDGAIRFDPGTSE